MDIYRGLWEKDTVRGNSMLLKTPGYLLQSAHHQRQRSRQSQGRHRAPKISTYHCEKTNIKVVWACRTIIRASQDNPTRHRHSTEMEEDLMKMMVNMTAELMPYYREYR
ncbi:hypothetical protein DPMN_059689 [Dreissena polymorpha]|uniref:Uncharacterized protein n=1 Tax=Dreissena polymorpha TaxID=45954 RepID=A0A9D4C4I7_DREPO|nr:hypothetical protein DPMN_059689 [Dreissena polymorpha]